MAASPSNHGEGTVAAPEPDPLSLASFSDSGHRQLVLPCVKTETPAQVAMAYLQIAIAIYLFVEHDLFLRGIML
jgi:hypothetical protein